MNRDSKQAVLDAFDALIKVRVPVPNHVHHGGKGGSGFMCDFCSAAEGSGGHRPDCPIGTALTQLDRIVPAYEDRQKWLAVPEPKGNV